MMVENKYLCEHQGLTVVAVGARLLPPHGPLQVHIGCVPGLLRALKPLVHHRSFDLALMPRCQNWLIPQYTLEGVEVSGGVAE